MAPFKQKKVGRIDISFMEYSTSKLVCLTPDIVEYEVGAPSPFYDLIIGKKTLQDIGFFLLGKNSLRLKCKCIVHAVVFKTMWNKVEL
jgi:hypothetical protein